MLILIIQNMYNLLKLTNVNKYLFPAQNYLGTLLKAIITTFNSMPKHNHFLNLIYKFIIKFVTRKIKTIKVLLYLNHLLEILNYY